NDPLPAAFRLTWPLAPTLSTLVPLPRPLEGVPMRCLCRPWPRTFLVLAVLGMVLPLAVAEDAPKDKALIVVKLPANAELRIGTSATVQTGPERLFISPPLTPGKSYSYQMVAIWKEGGKEKKVTRRVPVKAGETSTVDFTEPDEKEP